MEQTIPIHTLKDQFSQYVQQVSQEQLNLIVTKHGKPILRVLPYLLPIEGGLNALQGTALLKDDLVASTDTSWDSHEDTHVYS